MRPKHGAALSRPQGLRSGEPALNATPEAEVVLTGRVWGTEACGSGRYKARCNGSAALLAGVLG